MQIVLGLYLVSVLVSRVYLGVHYPSDVLASLCVGLGVLFIEFPFYDKLRFQWRFKGKQKWVSNSFEEKEMKVNIADLHPTQLYLSEKEVARYSDALPVGRNNPSRSNQYSCLWKLLVDYRWTSQGLSGFIGRSGYDFCWVGIEMVVMNYIISMRKLVRKEWFTLFWI